MTKGLKERKMRSFQWAIEIRWFDLVGYHHLPAKKEDLLSGKVLRKSAKIQLLTHGHAGQYEKIIVTVFCPGDGAKIDAKNFFFADYLEWPDDEGPAYTGEKLYISKDIDYQWAVEPKSTRPICAAIEEWIDMYREDEDEDN